MFAYLLSPQEKEDKILSDLIKLKEKADRYGVRISWELQSKDVPVYDAHGNLVKFKNL